MEESLDDSVVRACQQDNNSAYEVLLKRHYKDVFALCLGILGNLHDAEDVAQEAMLKGFLNIKKLDKHEQFEAWILRIAKNLCLDFLRRKKRIKVHNVKQPMQYHPNAGENHDLQQAIRRMPRELRLPLTMYYFDGKTQRLSQRNLKSRIPVHVRESELQENNCMNC